MANIITLQAIKDALGVLDEELLLLEFDKKHANLAKNKGKFQPLAQYTILGLNEETDSPIYLGILKATGEVATLDEYKEYQIKTANVELEKLEKDKQDLESKIAELLITNDKLTEDSWSIRDDYAKVAEEFDELTDLLEDLKQETKRECRKLKRKIRKELQQMGFTEKLKFLMS
ncbi:hypothetical protein F6P74_07170 [Streptococcus suis]|uniref:Phage protein n=3 Tax=Streptococcus suis TaxID=1307 RepID=A0A4T2GVW7_STRSU|nr:hypothetical protein [Streptococcus suis]MBS8071306.1 hypothetical protein [Streptococcus suis]MBS8094344.1 hypothetical protein [Streptococcus suis]MBS8103729.1 hypothetical protein [Streptococcus suis]MBY4965538.1 hypothetical protein [Streptococcus suis]MBY4976491.1 hypothetical protein [Streptococcus suis]